MKQYSLLIAILLFGSCSTSDKEDLALIPKIDRVPEWDETSHGNISKPNYDIVFPDFELNSITIDIGAENWQKISNNMVNLTGRYFGGAVAPGIIPPPSVGGLDAVPGDPIFISTSLSHQGKNWQNVGFRLKGNASLSGSWRSGIYKLPFKLKFDEFEDQYPQISNQRFYGFKELSFSPCYGDNSFMKDKLVADLFIEAGVPACRTAFYKVYLNFGEGLKYCGVYTAIEVIEDTMTKTQFGNNNGNVYKPESNFLNFDISKFEKQNNKPQSDYGDIQNVIAVLNNSSRMGNHKQWKKDLEKVFDVSHFLKWLAINNTIVNWDTYGVLTHNYYVYNHDGKITWIPYDHNLSMQFQGGLNNSRFAVSLELKEVTAAWPLIRYLADDEDYYKEYKGYVSDFLKKTLDPDKIATKISKYYTLIQPYVNGSEPEQLGYTHLKLPVNFENAVLSVKNHIYARYTAAAAFVKK